MSAHEAALAAAIETIRVLHTELAAYKRMLRRLAVAFFVQTCFVVAWEAYRLGHAAGLTIGGKL